METGRFTIRFLCQILSLVCFALPSPVFGLQAYDDLVLTLRNFSTSSQQTLAGRVLRAPKDIARFYEARGWKPAWLDSTTKLNVQGEALRVSLRDTWQDGLLPEDYHSDTLERLTLSPSETSQLMATEILLTDAFLALAQDVAAGRIEPKDLSSELAIRRKRIDVVKELTEALAKAEVAQALKRLAPPHARYRKLKAALARYATYAVNGPFAVVSDGPMLRRGATDDRLLAVRVRLFQEGFLDNLVTAPEHFDRALELALKEFQASRGIEPTGQVNFVTVAAMNVGLEKLIRQIEANLERLRWLPRQLEDRYVFVDIANYKLVAFEGGRPTLSMRIIVGGDFRRTPMFSTKLTSITLNPYWTIPRSIVAEEILPKVRANPRYLVNHDIRVTEDTQGMRREVDPNSVDWNRVRRDGYPYLFKQHSGPRNPLGTVKFGMQSEFAIYLHGTPNARLFDREQRNLSHGCIRVENPVALAAQILKDTPWSTRSIRDAIRNEGELSLPLAEAVPVHVWYRTAWVDERGRLQFRRDTYGWDETLGDALEGLTPVIPKNLSYVLRGRPAPHKK